MLSLIFFFSPPPASIRPFLSPCLWSSSSTVLFSPNFLLYPLILSLFHSLSIWCLSMSINQSAQAPWPKQLHRDSLLLSLSLSSPVSFLFFSKTVTDSPPTQVHTHTHTRKKSINISQSWLWFQPGLKLLWLMVELFHPSENLLLCAESWFSQCTLQKTGWKNCAKMSCSNVFHTVVFGSIHHHRVNANH